MQTWEMIKELTEHPKKKFRNQADYVASTNGILLVFEHPGFTTSGISKNIVLIDGSLRKADEWEEIKQPVPFLDAVKAFSEGKTIRCVGMAVPQIYSPNMAATTIPLKALHGACITDKEVLDGEWYIED